MRNLVLILSFFIFFRKLNLGSANAIRRAVNHDWPAQDFKMK
jgi:hypothetical protein